jgi:hypothetical protein
MRDPGCLTNLWIFTACYRGSFNFLFNSYIRYNRDSSVAIVTGYELEGWGSISVRGKAFLFSITSRPALKPT